MRATQLLRSGIAMIGLGLGLNCSSPTSPDDGPFAANWIGPTGVDTWTELHLHQHGTVVKGAYVMASANFGGTRDSVPVTGTATGNAASLSWVERNGETYNFHADVTLAADGQSFSGTLDVNGGPPLSLGTYRRITSDVVMARARP